MFNKFLIIPYF